MASKPNDFAAVRRDIAAVIPDASHDDGSLAPLFIRFAWHNSGTYDKASNTGGSNGCTMRFKPEASDPENAGFEKAFATLDPIAEKHKPWLSHADLYALAGYVAIEEAGGPRIPFSYGRRDYTHEEAVKVYGANACPFGDGAFSPHGSRLPAADLGRAANTSGKDDKSLSEKPTIDAVRNTFTRMGFTDKETVALILFGHQFGRCHPDVSGNEHAWYAFDPTQWSAYTGGLGYLSAARMSGEPNGAWKESVSSAGKRQFNAKLMGHTFMQLVSDMVLVWDDSYRTHVHYYDQHRVQFRTDAATVWKKLTELGCDGILTPEPAR